jgi:basic membrane protein A
VLAALRTAREVLGVRSLLVLVGVLLLTHVALLYVHPAPPAAATSSGGLDIGIVFDVGGRGDKSFNDGAYRGGERAEHDIGARVHFVEPGEGSDREAGLRLLSAEHMRLVIGVGFIFTDDLTKLAREYPDTHFAGVDYALALDSAGNVIPPPPNLAALKFREEQGSFLVGALAALV